MDVYMQAQESRSQSTVNRSTEFEVTTSLRRNTVRTSVIVGYGVKMKRRLCVSVQCASRYYFFSEVDKDVVDPRYRWAATQLEEEQPFTVSLERRLSTDGKTTSEYKFGSFHQEVARTDLPRINLNENTSTYMIVRELGERGSSTSSEESRVLACAIFLDFFVQTRSIVMLTNLPWNDWHFSPWRAIMGENWTERQVINWPALAAGHNGGKLSRKANDKLARSGRTP